MMRPTTAVILVLLSAACAAPGAAPGSPEATVEAFRAARERGDLEAARELMGDDPRVWYGERAGEGSPWRLGGGRWKDWDDHFRGVSERGSDWVVEGDTVHADFFEINDYFRLTERGGGWWRGTYFLAPDGRLAGFMVSSAPGRATPEGRGDEFRAWAFEARPTEAEYLMPDGSIDPTGDRAPRMRALLEEWRATVGLPPLRSAPAAGA